MFASDGVWDNLSSQDLLRTISRHMTALGAWQSGGMGIAVGDRLYQLTKDLGEMDGQVGQGNLQCLLAAAVVAEAKQASVDSRRDGPFAREVQRHFPEENYRGGKMDDICVVVAVVVHSEG